jgi:hypothetical protein
MSPAFDAKDHMQRRFVKMRIGATGINVYIIVTKQCTACTNAANGTFHQALRSPRGDVAPTVRRCSKSTAVMGKATLHPAGTSYAKCAINAAIQILRARANGFTP